MQARYKPSISHSLDGWSAQHELYMFVSNKRCTPQVQRLKTQENPQAC